MGGSQVSGLWGRITDSFVSLQPHEPLHLYCGQLGHCAHDGGTSETENLAQGRPEACSKSHIHRLEALWAQGVAWSRDLPTRLLALAVPLRRKRPQFLYL